jgi:hypothetical protein
VAEIFKFGGWERTVQARGAGMAARPASAQGREAGSVRTV